MKITQKQQQRLTLTQVAIAAGSIGLLVVLIYVVSDLFKSKESIAIPSNAAEFSETCYSIADGGAGLFEFNKYTGNPTSPGNTGIGSPEAGTLNLFGDTLFIIDGNAGEFGYVNLTNGNWTVVNSNYSSTQLNGVDGKITFADIDAMTVDNKDILWVASRDNNDTDPSYLAKMNHKGEFILNAFGVGVDYVKYNSPQGFPSVIDAMAYDPIDEILFVCANDGSGNPTYNNMMKVNPTDGVGTFVGNFSVGDVEGMGFDGEGKMFVTTGTTSVTTSNKNSFFSVDKKTAKATKVFTFSGETDFETCDCVIGYKNAIKGTIFYDSDENGFLGSGESGHKNVTVNLYYDENNNGVYDAGTDGFIRSTKTNELGEYILFDAYESGTLNYVVTISTSDLPNGHTLTTDNIEVASFSSGGNTDLHNDFGYKLSSVSNNIISGFVYKDNNQDQSFGSSETGVQGAEVYLYQDVNGNGVYNAGVDIIVTSQPTAADGSYSFNRPYLGSTVLVSSSISSANADAEQAGTAMNLGSSDLDIGETNVGMNFSNITLPQGAVIENAYIELVSASTGTSATIVSIYGEDNDNASAFSTSSNNLTSRTQTSANVEWIMPYWNATGITYQSPNISNIVQEIVDRSGWASGNNINLIIPQTDGRRSAVTYDNDPANTPKLVILYSDPSATDNYLTFVDESTLPTSSTLTTDNIETASFASGGNVDPNNNFGIYQDLTSFNTVSGTVFHDKNSDAVFNGIDLGENKITVCLFDDVNANAQYDAGLDKLLQIKKTNSDGTYSFEEPYTGSEILSATRVSQSDDDADDSPVTITSTDLDIASVDVAIKFRNIVIPQGATITTAYINFMAEENASGSYSTNIEGIDVNNTSSFSAGQNFSRLQRTSASTTWSGTDAYSIGQPKTTPSLVSIAQEIVNRNGWSSGNSMGFILNAGTGKRAAESYNGDPTNAPQLVIGYQVDEVNYVVIIKEDNLPNGYELTTDNIETASFDIGGNTDSGNDFGYKLNTSGLNIISGKVFNDANKDGILDPSETGIASVNLELYADLNCNGVIDNGETQIGTAVSNVDGVYSFNQNFTNTVSSTVNGSNDDVESGTTDTDLDFAQTNVAIRFNNISVPMGSTILNAYIEFTAEVTKTGTFSFSVDGVDADNIGTFSTSQNFNSLPRTTASSLMSGSNTWTGGNKYNSSSLTTIVQEIINRNGWSSDNSMAFVFNTGSGDRDAESFDSDPGKAPRLVIEYEPNNLCYIVQFPGTSVDQNANLTTASIQTASFNSSGNTDPNNDFGIYYTPLPVELLSFTANWMGNSVQLNWTTATEINNDYFDVQWSTDGVSYESVGTVEGNGNSLKEINYSFVHEWPKQANYYRLKQQDYDGAYEYSPTIILNREGQNKTSIVALPNPFSNELSINVTSPTTTTAELEIRSIDGRIAYSKQVNLVEGNQTVFIERAGDLEFGTYVVVLNTGKEVLTLKIVKR